jgi:hypothetical protein
MKLLFAFAFFCVIAGFFTTKVRPQKRAGILFGVCLLVMVGYYFLGMM